MFFFLCVFWGGYSRLARFYTNIQKLLLNDTEVQQLGRLWHEMSSFSNFMETLRNNPSAVSGEVKKEESGQ